MANTSPDIEFTRNRELHSDGSVTFLCTEDAEAWRWLALHPHHPIPLQNLQYWASVEVARVRGTFDGTKWTALTWTRWNCGDASVGNPVRGVSESVEEDGKFQGQLTFFDANDSMVSTMRSLGVEFRTRDFESWREKAKQTSGEIVPVDAFDFAKPSAVGSENIGPSFVSPIIDDNAPHVLGLMTLENAFPPAHRFMSGSGDHVNSTHLAEAAHQFVHLLEDSAALRITGGEMRFTHYVELGRPFRIDLVERSAGNATVQISQNGHDCTHITMGYEPA